MADPRERTIRIPFIPVTNDTNSRHNQLRHTDENYENFQFSAICEVSKNLRDDLFQIIFWIGTGFLTGVGCACVSYDRDVISPYVRSIMKTFVTNATNYEFDKILYKFLKNRD